MGDACVRSRLTGELLYALTDAPPGADVSVVRSDIRTVRTDKTARRCALVLGMHRSGTSMISRLLIRAGLQGPRTPMPANQWNVTGYGESAVLYQFHEALLEGIDSQWDSYEAIQPAWFASESAASRRAEAQTLLAREFDLSQPFVLKDPRIARLLPLWLEVFTAEQIAASAVVVIRHPVDVADSLSRRDELPRSLSLLVWLRHVLDAERWSRGLPRVVVRYDQAFADWRQMADRLSTVLLPLGSSSSLASIQGFAQPELRHHAAVDATWDASPRVANWLDRAWTALLTLADARETDTHGALSELDAVRQEFDLEVNAFSADSQRLRRKAALHLEQLRQCEAESRLVAACLSEQLRLCEAERDFQGREALRRIGDQDAEITACQGVIGQMDRDAKQAQSHIRTLESERAAMRASLSWRATAPLRWLGRLVR
jgi:hypothetical protein